MSKANEFIKRVSKREEFTLSNGMIIYMRMISGTLGMEIATKYRDADKDTKPDEMDAIKIVADTVLDDEGNLMFDNPKQALLMPFNILIEIARKAQQMSGLLKEEGEDPLPKD